MMNDAEPEIEPVRPIDKILQVLFQVQVPDRGLDIDIIVIGIDPDLIIVVAVDKGRIGEEAAVEYMIPTGRTRNIPIIDTKSISESQVVPAEITREIDPVLCVERIIGLDVHVVEIEAVAVDRRIMGKF